MLSDVGDRKSRQSLILSISHLVVKRNENKLRVNRVLLMVLGQEDRKFVNMKSNFTTINLLFGVKVVVYRRLTRNSLTIH